MGRRILITGLGSFWGGRVAQALESDPNVDVLIGLDTEVPKVELERTEYVRTDQGYSILSRIVAATQVDTIVHTFLPVDSTRISAPRLHEISVIGTMNLLAAASAPNSPVRHVVVKSSGLVYGSAQTDPTWFREGSTRTSPARTRVERSLIEVEGYLRDFAQDNPDVVVTLLRFANVLGPDVVTPISKSLSGAFAPCIFGFDPQMQFVEEGDVVRCLEFVTHNQVPGTFNVAGDGRLVWSEVADMCASRLVPLPPLLTEWSAAPLSLLRLADIPPELLSLLRYGRGMDNTKLKAAGFEYNYTSAGAVQRFVQANRLRAGAGKSPPAYHFESDVENFFRHSPAVVRRHEPA
ncbi:MAG: NAD-dependent epimerase/dehydratase family protein [Acidimicrobiales bacterium]